MIPCTREEPQTMLREIKFVRQEPGSRRRWFETTGLELIVWYDQADAHLGFQMLYWLNGDEYAVTWRPASGFNHCRVDAGDESPFRNDTPILQPGGVVPWRYLEDLFRQRAGSLEADLRDHILSRLQAQS
jgi:hypothetical protein